MQAFDMHVATSGPAVLASPRDRADYFFHANNTNAVVGLGVARIGVVGPSGGVCWRSRSSLQHVAACFRRDCVADALLQLHIRADGATSRIFFAAPSR